MAPSGTPSIPVLFYVHCPSDADSVLAVAQRAEHLGFDGVSMADHVAMPVNMASVYPYSEDGTCPYLHDDFFDVWVSFAAMAAVTKRLRFLTEVYVAALRHPILTAKAIATLSVISGGRVELGVGAGWMAEEFEALGVDFDRRGSVLEETVTACRRLWSPGPAEHHGQHWDFDLVHFNPKPPAPVPVLVGGTSERALRRAAQWGDGYVGRRENVQRCLELTARLRALRTDLGRSADPFRVQFSTLGITLEECAQLAKGGIDAITYINRAKQLDRLLEHMEAFAAEVMWPFRHQTGEKVVSQA